MLMLLRQCNSAAQQRKEWKVNRASAELRRTEFANPPPPTILNVRMLQCVRPSLLRKHTQL